MQISVDQVKSLQERQQYIRHESVLRLLNSRSEKVSNNRNTMYFPASGHLITVGSMSNAQKCSSLGNQQAELEFYFRNQNKMDQSFQALCTDVLRRLGVRERELEVAEEKGGHTSGLHENRVVKRMGEYASTDEVRSACEEMRLRNRERLNHAGNKIEFMNGYESTCRLSQLVKVKWNNDDFCFTGKVIDAEENASNRQMINRQINNILNGAGINISDEDNIVFSIEPYEYKITVTGNISDEKCKQIEQVLNNKDNGKNLYDHIYFCAKNYWESSSQLSKWGQLKRQMNDFFYEKLGVKLFKCEKQGNDFVTEDGKSVRAMASHNDMYTHYLNLLTPHDYHDDDSQVLEIAYNSTGLHDLHQNHSYGNGDYEWIYDEIEQVRTKRGKEVFNLFV